MNARFMTCLFGALVKNELFASALLTRYEQRESHVVLTHTRHRSFWRSGGAVPHARYGETRLPTPHAVS